MHTNMHTCNHILSRTDTHTGRNTYTHTSTHTYIPRGRHPYTHTYTHTYITTCIHTYIHPYMHTGEAGIHTHLHAYIHTARNINAYMQSYGQYKTIKNQYRTGKGMTIQDMAYNQTATQ